MMPAAAMVSSYMPYAANCENSRNGDPVSRSARTRSRGSSLPRPVWRSRARSPRLARSRRPRAFRSATSAASGVAVAREHRTAGIEAGFDDGHEQLAYRFTVVAGSGWPGINS